MALRGREIHSRYDALLGRAHTGPIIRSTVAEDGLSRPEAGLDNAGKELVPMLCSILDRLKDLTSGRRMFRSWQQPLLWL